ncbi:MAG: anhydro-N-acetylmuramic acid kinase [Bacteroidales bacterium]|nr:anhydro-N-acetylmuramic acid kinase [Bacteroidales bacterium]
MYYKVLGLMSGTSLDGLDMAYCEFDVTDNCVVYNISHAVTEEYDQSIKQKILRCESCSGEELSFYSTFLGNYFGKKAKDFLSKHNLTVDFIASHGQTVFHRPEKGFTVQIGDINAIAAQAQTNVIGDFRSLDVALGGQGAPLVPIGDKLLFSQYECCLNIGGFSNISYDKNNKRTAYDICPSNIVLNMLAEQLGYAYDKDGDTARHGKVNEDLLNCLNNADYYKRKIHKSLGKEWVKENVSPVLEIFDIPTQDKLATFTEHVAQQISRNICGETLVTGGGAKNKYLIEKIRQKTVHNILIPDDVLIDYKEALIFAFLGLRRWREEINCLASVTGARQDSCTGVVVHYKNV